MAEVSVSRIYPRECDHSGLLHQLWEKHGAAKGDLIPYYEEHLRPRRQSVRKMLEVGIGYAGYAGLPGQYRTGASLFMWEEFFPNAEIYGLDISPEAMVNHGRIHSFICDQSNEASLRKSAFELGREFDLIIDDGSHDPEHQVLTARNFIPLLQADGIYIIEDIASQRRAEVADGIPYRSEFKEFLTASGGLIDLMLVIKMSEQPTVLA